MKLSVATLFRSMTFVGVVAGFIFANAFSWARHRFWPICCDQEVTIGFPVPFHISGGIAGLSNFYLLGLMLDTVLALTVAVTLTWVVLLFKRQKGD
jgi:hypothetical protein